jgi:hypothetical protein
MPTTTETGSLRQREPWGDHDVGAELVDDRDHAGRIVVGRRATAHQGRARVAHGVAPVGRSGVELDGVVGHLGQRHG